MVSFQYLTAHFGLTSFQEGLAGASAIAGCIPGAMFAGFLSDRFGRRRVLFLCAILYAVSGLLSAVPRPDPSGARAFIRLEGAVPSAQHPPSGCRFHTRCPSKVGRICEEVEPPLQRAGASHWIACHIPLETLRRERSVLPPTPSGKDRP